MEPGMEPGATWNFQMHRITLPNFKSVDQTVYHYQNLKKKINGGDV
jgi:hypothetical protein